MIISCVQSTSALSKLCELPTKSNFFWGPSMAQDRKANCLSTVLLHISNDDPQLNIRRSFRTFICLALELIQVCGSALCNDASSLCRRQIIVAENAVFSFDHRQDEAADGRYWAASHIDTTTVFNYDPSDFVGTSSNVIGG